MADMTFNYLINVTSEPGNGSDPYDSTITDKVMKGFYIAIGSLGIMGNILVLIVLLGLTDMRKKVTSIFIINQSLIDSLTGFFLLLTTVLPSDDRIYTTLADEIYCRTWVTRLPLWLFIHCSTFNLVVLTLERYASVVHPIIHKVTYSRTKAILAVVLVWCVGIIYDVTGTVTTSYIKDGDCVTYSFKSEAAMKGVGIFGVCLNYFIPIFILIYCYSRMANSLTSKVVPVESGPASYKLNILEVAINHNKELNSLKAKSRKNIIRTLMIVGTAFILCTSWNQWFFFLYNLGLFEYKSLDSNFYHFSVAAMMANCCVNPFIYTAKYDEFKHGLKKMFGKKARNVHTGSRDNSTENSHI